MPRKTLVRRIVIVLIAAAILIACGILIQQKNHDKNTGKIEVTTSFYPLFAFAEAVGGNKAHVVNITPAGAEPHDYEPSAQDMVQMEQSKIIFVNGNGFEPWIANIQANIASRSSQTLLVATSEGLTNLSQKESQNIVDPHVWLSPQLAIRMVDTIASAFQTVDPQNIPYYQGNADELKIKLQQLDDSFTSKLTSCQTRSFVTSHAAFGYLAKEFNLEQVSLTGISPESEPTQQTLRDVADFVKKNNINYIFFESLLSPKLSETLAEETGAKTLVLNPLEGLTEKEIAAGENYFTVMQENLNNLQTALQCAK